MKLALTIFLSTAVIIGTSASAHANQAVAATCETIFKSPLLVATSKWRESAINQTERWQISMIDGTMLGKSDTPPFYLQVEEGIQANELIRSGGLHGDITHVEVSGVGAPGLLRGTLMLPVSGHTGFENAKAWAKTDTYSIYMQVGSGPKGDQFASYNNENTLTPVVLNAPSKDLVTLQDIEIPLEKGKQILLLYFRSGSGGPGGYPEGRLMLISWTGN